MDKQFTASEAWATREWLRTEIEMCMDEDQVQGLRRVARMLHAFAKLLEAREKAVPVGMLRIEADPSNQYGKTATFHYADACMDLSLGDHEMFPHPAPYKGATHCDNCGCTWLDDGNNPIGCPYCKLAPANAERLAEALREIARDRKPLALAFGEALHRVVEAALAAHSTQAQPADNELPGMWSHSDFVGGDPDERSYAERQALPPAASVMDALRTFARRVINICFDGDPDSDFVLEMAVSEGLLQLVPAGNGITADGAPAMRYDPTPILETALAAQENPNG